MPRGLPRRRPGKKPRARAGKVEIAWGVRARPISDRAVRSTVRAALAYGGRPRIDLAVALVSDARLAAIHGRFLGDPSPTDVISFDLGEGEGPAGEVYVSVDRARAVARERGDPLEREMALYLVHGTLHLCGYDDLDPAQRRRMRAAEAEVLAGLGWGTQGVRGGTGSARVNQKTKKTSRG
jgi:probable rRNA maturation factor